jgi:hypothetical protein
MKLPRTFQENFRVVLQNVKTKMGVDFDELFERIA